MTRHFQLFLTCVVGWLVIACESATKRSNVSDVAVYAAVLDSIFGADTATLRHGFVLHDSTTAVIRGKRVPPIWAVFDSVAQGDSALVRDFETRARVSTSLRAREAELKATLRVPFQIAGESAYDRISRSADSVRSAAAPAFLSFPDVYWKIFHDTFANATSSVSLSPIGYNKDGTAALLTVDRLCGSLCGAGHIVLLKHTPTGWHIHTIRMTWIS